MGRKSRRNTDTTPVVAVQNTDIFPTAIYARLSVENSGKDDDGAAIENQIDVCKEYIRDMPDLQLVKVYQDNGWTGTNMNRPAFDAMMDEVRAGRIRTIVVRDLSRFGRNYLETGTYLEKIFPRLDVRFISVKENFDTYRTDGSAESLMIPLQNLINDLYAKDISRKIHAVFKVQKEEKTFSWRTIPYGYEWNEDHTGIIVEREQSEIVREIYRMYLDGTGTYLIATELNRRHVQTSNQKKRGGNYVWSAQSVTSILKNPAYTGVMAWGRSKSELYRNYSTFHTPREEWAIRENDHEAIISQEDYDAVQELFERSCERTQKALERTKEQRKTCVDLFKGKLFCGDCGNRMYYTASVAYNNKVYGRYNCKSDEMRRTGCSRHNISKKRLDSKVLKVIQSQMDLALEYEKVLLRLRNSEYRKKREQKLKRQVSVVSGKLRSIQERRTRLYEDYTEGILDIEEYSLAKQTYERQADEFDKAYGMAVEELRIFEESISEKNQWIMMLKEADRDMDLTQELVDSTVDRVYVYEDNAVEVVMKHQDIFDFTKDYVEKGGGLNE